MFVKKFENIKEHSVALDSMRGIAVLFVFLSHASGREMAIAPWLNFHGIGHIGVYLFFVLSGFLLTKNLLRGQTTYQFFLRRFFRIVPLYFLVLTAVFVYQNYGYYSPRYLHIEGGWRSFGAHLLFLKGDGLFWTLAAEFAFYLLLPLIVLITNRFGRKWLVAAIAIYFIWFLIILMGGRLIPLKFVVISHESQFLDVFMCGILAAYIDFKLPEKTITLLFWGLLFLSLLCVSKNFIGAKQICYSLRWVSILYGVVFSLAVVSVTQGNRGLIVPLKSKFLASIGVTGFSWYLLHFPVMQMVNFSFVHFTPFSRFFISSLLVSFLAYLTFLIVERPGIFLGRRVEALVEKMNLLNKHKTHFI